MNWPLPTSGCDTDNKGSIMRTIAVGSRNGHTFVGDFFKRVSQ